MQAIAEIEEEWTAEVEYEEWWMLLCYLENVINQVNKHVSIFENDSSLLPTMYSHTLFFLKSVKSVFLKIGSDF